jgi:hypothetical protein
LYASAFNQLLIELAHDRSFCEVWGIPPYEDNVDRRGNITNELRDNPYYQRMIDCEIVLRFFALRDRANIRGSVKAMLDRCMEDNLHTLRADLDNMADLFRSHLELSLRVFGNDAFKYEEPETGEITLSQPLWDGTMIALGNLWAQRKALTSNRRSVRTALSRLLRRPSAYEVVVGKPNTAKAVKRRHDLLTRAFAEAVR